MPLKIYNSLKGQKEIFEPLQKGRVGMYVCGPTVYDEPHLGHLRSAYVFEMMRRYLESDFCGYKVTFVRNVTDVDDKIIEKAAESGGTDLVGETKKVSQKYYLRYQEDLRELGLSAPTHEPRATEHIPNMLDCIDRLVEKGAAYESGGDVYFDVASFKNYGKLSHQNKEAMLQNVRIQKNEKKRNDLDFTLWKGASENEPAWESRWGKGRPGWHIECSAMSMKYLGETFDIHGGGRDLIFPHHENEIAQSEMATSKPLAKFWIHHGLVTAENQKMSKSLKNFTMLKDVRQKDPHAIEDLKFLFLGTHYSMPLDYSEDRMKMEKSIREKFIQFLMRAEGFRGAKSLIWKEYLPKMNEFELKFKEAMDDDFNTSQALTVMHEMLHFAEKSDKMGLRVLTADKIKDFFKIFCLSFSDAYICPELAKISDEIRDLISKREDAKRSKDFKKADEIRQSIMEKHGLKLIDEKDGTTRWVKL